MATTFQLSAIDLYDIDALWGNEAESRDLAGLRLCSVTNCDDFADGGDEFCPRCRDEIDAVRETGSRNLLSGRSRV